MFDLSGWKAYLVFAAVAACVGTGVAVRKWRDKRVEARLSEWIRQKNARCDGDRPARDH
jgi:hypothetical protein